MRKKERKKERVKITGKKRKKKTRVIDFTSVMVFLCKQILDARMISDTDTSSLQSFTCLPAHPFRDFTAHTHPDQQPYQEVNDLPRASDVCD